MEFETITRECVICGGPAEMPRDTFAVMAEMPKLVSRSFREPRAAGKGEGWTPHEIAAHLADVEVVLGWRLRQVLAEDGPLLQPFDQDQWAASLNYSSRELATSLATYAANRQSTLELIRLAGESALDRPYTHPQHASGPIRNFVEHIADHDVAHLRQIRGEA